MVWAALALFVTVSLALFLYINCSQVSSLHRPSKVIFNQKNREGDRLAVLGKAKLLVVSSMLQHCFRGLILLYICVLVCIDTWPAAVPLALHQPISQTID